MKQNTIYTILGLALLLLPLTSETSKGKIILQEIDKTTNFTQNDFSSTVTMITEDPEDGIDKKTVKMFRRDNEDTFVMLIQEPSIERGQGYLRVDDNLWFYDPESRKFSHTSMKDHFGNTNAKNSDFRTSTMAIDYNVAKIEESTLGKYSVNILELEAVNDEVTYPFMKIWVEKENNLVLKAENYSLTKRLLRTSYYPSYSKIGETYISSRMIFVDNLVEGRKTQVILKDTSMVKIPDTVFTKSYIERVNR